MVIENKHVGSGGGYGGEKPCTGEFELKNLKGKEHVEVQA